MPLRTLLLFFCISYSYTVLAQPSFPPPSGVYCSCGPTTGNGYGSVNPNIAAKPFVKGILVRIGWEILEPADNIYNWALIDTQINRAKQYGKKVSLGIGNGIQAPQWLFNSGAQRLIATAPFNDTLPIPWDAIYLGKWKELIADIGNRYKNDTTINLVYITNATGNGYEMQLPQNTTPTLAAAGYTDSLMTYSWKESIDAFSAAFPNHYLSNDFHPVNNSDAVADSVYAYAQTTIGSRYGAGAWWWTQKNTTVYPAQYNIMKHSSANNYFSTVQFAKSGTSDSASFGPGGMPGAMQLAVNDGICYWEIWNNDILNPQFDSLLSNISCNYVSVSEAPQKAVANIFPNPTNGVVNISLTNTPAEIIITNISGKVVSKTSTSTKQITVNLAGQSKGIYFIQIRSSKGIQNTKLLLE